MDNDTLRNGKEPCPQCPDHFVLRSLVVHLQRIHGFSKEQISNFRKERLESKTESINNDFKCGSCSKTYKDAASVRRHMNRVHGSERGSVYTNQNEKSIPGNHQHVCYICHREFTRLCYLNSHVMESHSGDFDSDSRILTFSDENSFQNWLDKAKKMTSTSLFIRTSTKNVRRYLCHRVGRFDSISLKRTGHMTNKTEESCSSFVTATVLPQGQILAHFSFSHSHEIDHCHLKFTNCDIEYIINEVKLSRTDEQIVQFMRNTRKDDDKLFYITRDEIRKIKDEYGLFNGRRHSIDLYSVEMASKEDDNIRFFQMPKDKSGDGFSLVYINDLQLEWMKLYASKGVILDDTFNITMYHIRLVTLLVLDDRGYSRPAAFFLSNKMTANDVSILFAQIKNLLPQFCPSTIMTDEAPQFFNAYATVIISINYPNSDQNCFTPILQVFPENQLKTQKLICHYHLFNSLKRQALKHMKIESQLPLRLLYIMMVTYELAEYERARMKLKSFCQTVEGGEAFFTHFQNRYDSSRAQWVSYERKYSPYNTSSSAESWHNYLKSHKLKRNQNIRIDSLLTILNDATREIDLTRRVEIAKGLALSHSRLSQSNRNHLKMVRERQKYEIKELGNNRFAISIESSVTVKLERRSEKCGCNPKVNNHCRYCQVCYYEYICSCRDSAPGVACSHMHLLQEHFEQKNEKKDDNSDALENDDNDELSQLNDDAMEWEDDDRVAVPFQDKNEFDNYGNQNNQKGLKNNEKELDPVAAHAHNMQCLSQIRESLDALHIFATKLSKDKSQNGFTIMSDLSREVSSWSHSLLVKNHSNNPDVPVRSEVYDNPKIRDKTIREKYGLTKRKKVQKSVECDAKILKFNDNDVAFCCICDMTDPPGIETEVSWKACLTCKLWVHEFCADKHKNSCYVCDGEYEYAETI